MSTAAFHETMVLFVAFICASFASYALSWTAISDVLHLVEIDRP